MLFSEITGHAELKNTLIQAVKNNHVAHAQLFSAAEGTANLAMALAYINYIFCEDPQETDSCGKCVACLKMAKYIHPDLHFIFPVATTKKITKEPISQDFYPDWRLFLKDNPYGNLSDWSNFIGTENKQPNISKEESRNIIKYLTLKPFEANTKVMLIWLPEYMHPSAANAILKILEEPPGQSLFILVCNNQERLLPTIISRTQIIKIRNFSDDELKEILVSKYQVTEKKAEQVVHLADGSLTQVLKLNNEVEEDNHILFRDWMRICYMRDFGKLVEWADNFQGLSKESQKIILHYGLNMFRDCLIYRQGVTELVKLQGEELDFVKNFSKVLEEDQLEKAITQFNTSFYHLERNASPKILFLDMSLMLSVTFRQNR